MKSVFTSLFVLFSLSLFSQAGALDGTFNTNGKYRDVQGSYRYGQIAFQKVAIQPDGKILMAGNNGAINLGVLNIRLERLNTDGTLDASFGNSGRLDLDFSRPGMTNINTYLGGIAVQPDGKILLAGFAVNEGLTYVDSTQTYNVSDIVVNRLNSDGSYDLSFNGTGKQYLDFSALVRNKNAPDNTSRDICNAIAVRANGKIVLGGSTYNNNNQSTPYPTGDFDALIVQLKANGSLDSTFSADGVQVFAKAGTNEDASAINIQTDNKIVWTGNSTGTSASTHVVFVIRTTTAGALDKTFNSKGYTTTNLGTNGGTYSVSAVLQTDGKIVVSGYQDTKLASFDSTNAFLLRYNANGALDAGFGNKGKAIFARPSELNNGRGVALQKDGKIVQVGFNFRGNNEYSEFEGGYNYQVLRYKTNGTLDSSFGAFGRTLIDLGNWFPLSTSGVQSEPSARADSAYDCAIQADGKIVVTGSSTLFYYEETGGGLGGSAVRLLSTGTNYAIAAPADQSANLTNQCSASFANIDPKVTPDTSLSIVKYRLYKISYGNSSTLYDSGYGSLSNKPIDIGNYYALYSSIIDSNQRATFKISVTGGLNAGALDFDGVDDRVDLTNPPVFISPDHYYTFESWIKVRGYNKNGGSVIFSNQHGKDSGILVALNPNGYVATFQPKVGNVISSYKVQLNTWTHIAFIQTPQKLDLYVNGHFVQTLLTAPYLHANVSVNLGTNYAKAYLGTTTNDDVTFSKYFNGEIDNVRFWNKALCQTQLQNGMNCEFASNVYYPNAPLKEFTFDRGLASCKNPGLTTLAPYDNNNPTAFNGTLQNFYLDGPVSNWVAGLAKDTCAAVPALTIGTPANIVLYAQSGSCGAVANFTASASSVCTDSLKVSYSQNPGTLFPVGATSVTATASDKTGATANTVFTVTVYDTIAPTLVTKDTTVRLDKNSYAYINASAVIASVTDNCSSQAAPSYTVFPTSFTSAGTYTITVIATDKYNNKTTKYATVTVLPYRSSGLIAGGSKIAADDNSKLALQDDFSVVVSPNPAKDHFDLRVMNSRGADKISIRITDATGKLLDVFANVKTGQMVQFGYHYGSGIYIAEVQQGTSRKSYKLVRL